jgi:hypothetical protein
LRSGIPLTLWSRWVLADLVTHIGRHQSRVFIFVNALSEIHNDHAFYAKSDQITYFVEGSELIIKVPGDIWEGRIKIYRLFLIEFNDATMAQKACQLLSSAT